MKYHDSGHEHITVPALVERCRGLAKEWFNVTAQRFDEYPPLRADWKSFGIAESINIPADRPA